MKKNQILRTIMTITLTAVITFSITSLWLYGNNNIKNASVISGILQSDKLTTKINTIKSKIEKEYLRDYDENELTEWAVKGYVAGLNDIYSEYFTADEMAEYSADTLGEYVGIGVYITKNTETNQIVIYGTIKDSPAEKAGLQTNDILIEVDGKEVNGDNYSDITTKIKGKEGTKVKLKVQRGEEEKEFEITRKKVEIINVSSQMLDKGIGYIYISSFDGTKLNEQFEKEYNSLKDQGATTLIVDVRNNGGGIVDEALEIADLFTEKDTTLLIEKNKDGNEDVTKAKKDKTINMKTVLLVNQKSASASEILAGIFKDKVDNATLVGTTTFGKGVIQILYQLPDGSGLKITSREYYTPNHREIDGKGIDPDVKVSDYEYNGKIDLKNDTQLQKAIEILTEN